MAKYSLELKLKIVEYYLSGKVSFKDTAEKYSVNKADVQKWVAAYRKHNVAGLTSKPGMYTGDFKISVVEYMHNTGSSARQTSAYFNIPSYSTVCNWERIYIEKGASALLQNNRERIKSMSKKQKCIRKKSDKHTTEDLMEEVQRLRMENEYLKN